MPVLGSIEPYDGIDQFDSYIARLEHYFVANSIGDFPTGASAEVIQSAEKNGSDRPVAFASCTLTKSQRNYSQLDKEAFSIIFCLKRFHQFLYGRLFHIITDHKPLL